MTNIKPLIMISLFAALTAVGGMIVIPLGIVPITLQTFFVLYAGYVLGARNGAASQIFYIVLGLLGLPVYSKGGAGLGHLLGPTGGYLVGFVAAAYIVGKFTERTERSRTGLFVISCLAFCVLYACGIAQLMLVTHISLGAAVTMGAVVFIPGDVLKIVLLIAIRKFRTKN